MPSSKITARLAAACIIAAAIISAYCGGISAGFHWDDGHTILRNPAVRSIGAALRTFADPRGFSAFGAPMIRPLTVLSYAINYRISGFETISWHIFNLIIHFAAALAMMGIAANLLSRTGRDEEQSLLGGLAAGLFFALNPVQAETINYFSARSELLAATFSLAALYFHLRDKEQSNKWRILATLCFAAALTARESAAVFPVMALLCDFVFPQPDNKNRLKIAAKTWPYWVVLFMYFIYRRMLLGVFTGRDFVRGPLDQIIASVGAIGLYHKLILFPWSLSVHHPEPDYPLVSVLFWLGAFLIPIEIVLAKKVVKGPLFLFGVGIFYLGMLPTLVVPLNYPAAEHRIYLAMAGPALIFGWLVALAGNVRPKLVARLLLIITVVFAAAAREDNRKWEDDFTLWSAAVKIYPDDYLAWTQYGKALKDENKLREAIFAYRRSIEIQPNGAAYNNLAIACNLAGDKKCAIDAINKAIKIEPENPLAHLNLGLNYFEEGRSKEAEMEFREAIHLMPVFPEAHKNLALLLLSRTPSEEKEALEHLELSIKQDPYQEEVVIMKKKIAELRNRLKTVQ